MKSNTRWHPEIVPPRQWKILEDISKTLSLDSFYLAGGTGLALALGHRRSRDFDFFSAELFDEDRLLQKMKQESGVKVVSMAPHTLHLEIKGIKFSFIGYAYPQLFPLMHFKNTPALRIAVADIRDIACMKISALASRGSRRDFVDLYALSQTYVLEELLTLFERKFKSTSFNRLHILKSLVYFEDAEQEPMPEMLIDVSWNQVKDFFLSKIPKLLKA